jgi:inner membrane protein
MPTRKTHLIFAVLLFLVLQQTMNLPIALAAFAALGAILPDLDIKFMHRKLLHNIWALLAIAWLCAANGLLAMPQIMAFAIGWLSHLIADSLTHRGIMPLWPIPRPKFKGMITTGGASEFVLMIALLACVGFVTGFLRI